MIQREIRYIWEERACIGIQVYVYVRVSVCMYVCMYVHGALRSMDPRAV